MRQFMKTEQPVSVNKKMLPAKAPLKRKEKVRYELYEPRVLPDLQRPIKLARALSPLSLRKTLTKPLVTVETKRPQTRQSRKPLELLKTLPLKHVVLSPSVPRRRIISPIRSPKNIQLGKKLPLRTHKIELSNRPASNLTQI